MGVWWGGRLQSDEDKSTYVVTISPCDRNNSGRNTDQTHCIDSFLISEVLMSVEIAGLLLLVVSLVI